MATAYKYAQVQGTAAVGTFATLYTTPGSTEAVISSLVICNQSSSAITVRIGLDATEGTPGADEFLVYDASVAGNDTVALTLGITMPASKYLRVSSSANTIAFSAFLSEIT
tara:strand:+ start:19736 stop:20068 length:333 start_codon:yes stop_codon:yes gene_type:complete